MAQHGDGHKPLGEVSPKDDERTTFRARAELAFVVKVDDRRGYGAWFDGEWFFPFNDGAPGTRLDAIELLHALAIKQQQQRAREARDAQERGF